MLFLDIKWYGYGVNYHDIRGKLFHPQVRTYFLSFFEVVTVNSSGSLQLPKSCEPNPKTCERWHYYGLGFYTIKAYAGCYTCGFCKP